jgi:HSP20 family molecular chaperone IbpA
MVNNARYEPFWPAGRRSGPYGDPLFERFERVLQDAFGVTLAPAAADRERPGAAVNLYDTAEGYWLELPLPGVQADGVDLSVQQNLLTLKARREWAPPAAAQVIWQGFGAGQWQQTFALPGEVDAERVEARLADGVLRLHLPKAQHLRPRQITVQAGGAPKPISAPAGAEGTGAAPSTAS